MTGSRLRTLATGGLVAAGLLLPGGTALADHDRGRHEVRRHHRDHDRHRGHTRAYRHGRQHGLHQRGYLPHVRRPGVKVHVHGDHCGYRGPRALHHARARHLCRPCGRWFQRPALFHRHLHRHHRVPPRHFGNVLVQVGFGWVFPG